MGRFDRRNSMKSRRRKGQRKKKARAKRAAEQKPKTKAAS
jgi:hypothetical protein